MTSYARIADVTEDQVLDRIVARRVAMIAERHGLRTPVRAILEEVAAAAGVTAAALLSHSRAAELVELRHLVMWRAHKAGVPYAAIGRAMGRDHTTVMHGVRAEERRQGA